MRFPSAPATLAPALALLAATLGACGTTTLTGDVGDTLSGGGVDVTVRRVALKVPVPEHDVTGLATPAAGHKLIGAEVRVCSTNRAAIGSFDFEVALKGGGHGRLKFPQHSYPDSLDIVREGCDDGWVVFEIPRSTSPELLRFGFDDTGTAVRYGGGRPESHERFSWRLRGSS